MSTTVRFVFIKNNLQLIDNKFGHFGGYFHLDDE